MRVVLVLAMTTSGCVAGTPAPGPSSPTVGTDRTEDVRSVLARRAAHTATDLIDGSTVVVGGCDTDGCTSATASTVVVGPEGPASVSGLHDARDAHSATRLDDGSVLVAGGFAFEGQPPLTSAEIYDPAARSWSVVASLAVGRGGHAAARWGDGRVLVAGGWIRPRRYTATTEIFDPLRGQFSPGPDLPVAADGLAASALGDGSVLVTGGQVASGVATATAVVLRPDGSSTVVGPMRQARYKHAMVILPSGRVLVIGGTSDDHTLLTSTEIYDPVAQRFGPGPALVAGRYKLAGSAAVLPDGRVVVAGGGPGVEIIDPRTQSSKMVAGVDANRLSFSTVSVVGMDLRIIGGYDQEIRLTRTDLTIPLSRLS